MQRRTKTQTMAKMLMAALALTVAAMPAAYARVWGAWLKRIADGD